MCVLHFVIFLVICLPRQRDHGHYHVPSKAVALLLICGLAGIGHWRRPSYPLPTTCAVAPVVVRRRAMPLRRRDSPRSCPSIPVAAAACLLRRPSWVAMSPCHPGDLLTPSWPIAHPPHFVFVAARLANAVAPSGAVLMYQNYREINTATPRSPSRRNNDKGRASICPTIAADHG